MSRQSEQLAYLRTLLADATQGPWHIGAEGSEGSHIMAPGPTVMRNGIPFQKRVRVACIGGLVQPEDGRNARLIVAAVNMLPTLLDLAEAQAGESR